MTYAFPKYTSNTRHIAAAIYFLLLQTVYILTTTIPNASDRVFLLSFCNHIPLLLGLALLFDWTQFAKAVINLGVIIQGAWLIDFLVRLVFGFYLFDITEYVFMGPFFAIPNIVSIIEHSLTMIIAVAVTYKIRPRPISLVYSFLYIAALYLASLEFTLPVSDVNCVYQQCIFKSLLTVPQFTALWPAFVMILGALGYLVQRLLYRYFAFPNSASDIPAA
ncbi:MAG: hypothetical protein KGH79_04055 [Patescibacteria group bacterium]|nr:hypothetical protein [Patescibacteria group bacterium]